MSSENCNHVCSLYLFTFISVACEFINFQMEYELITQQQIFLVSVPSTYIQQCIDWLSFCGLCRLCVNKFIININACTCICKVYYLNKIFFSPVLSDGGNLSQAEETEDSQQGEVGRVKQLLLKSSLIFQWCIMNVVTVSEVGSCSSGGQ